VSAESITRFAGYRFQWGVVNIERRSRNKFEQQRVNSNVSAHRFTLGVTQSLLRLWAGNPEFANTGQETKSVSGRCTVDFLLRRINTKNDAGWSRSKINARTSLQESVEIEARRYGSQ